MSSFRKSAAQITVIATLLASNTALQAQAMRLDALVGKDLWKQAPSIDEQRYHAKILGRIPSGFDAKPIPWHVWKTNHDRRTRYIILLGEPLVIVPGGSSACVKILDGAATKVGSWSFQTGWRLSLRDARIQYDADLGSHLLVLDTVRYVNGRNVAKEYFADGTLMALIEILALDHTRASMRPSFSNCSAVSAYVN